MDEPDDDDSIPITGVPPDWTHTAINKPFEELPERIRQQIEDTVWELQTELSRDLKHLELELNALAELPTSSPRLDFRELETKRTYLRRRLAATKTQEHYLCNAQPAELLRTVAWIIKARRESAGPPAPPPHYRPPTPEGFVKFSDIPQALFTNAQLERNFGLWNLLYSRRGQPFEFWLDCDNWRDDIQRIEVTLSSGQHRAVGIDEATGDLIWIPPAAWRRPYPLGDRAIGPVEAGLLGLSIPLSGPGGLLTCFPMIRVRDLSSAFGADFVQIPAPPLNGLAYLFPQPPPPLPPRFVLDQIQELDERQRPALPALVDKISAWHEVWAKQHPLASDDEALKAANEKFTEEKVSRKSIRAMRRLPNGAHRPRGRKSGKSEAEFH